MDVQKQKIEEIQNSILIDRLRNKNIQLGIVDEQ